MTTPIERMKTKRAELYDRLLTNKDFLRWQELGAAIDLVESFTDDDPAEKAITLCKTKKSLRKGVKGAQSEAIRKSIQDALDRYQRPITAREVREFLPSYGYSREELPSARLSTVLAQTMRRLDKTNNSGWWPKDKPLPEESAWVRQLKTVSNITSEVS